MSAPVRIKAAPGRNAAGIRHDRQVARQPTRNRMLDDRLWDDDGREWRCDRSDRATPQQITQILGTDHPVALHGYGRRMRWLTQDEARTFWHRIVRHVEVPGRLATEPDEEGLTYTAHIWRNGDYRLLGIEIICWRAGSPRSNCLVGRDPLCARRRRRPRRV